jgi:hypothetical protein
MHEVLNCLVSKRFYERWIKFPTASTPPAAYMPADTRYNPYFLPCIGAIDGTHIKAQIPQHAHARYRNRKGFTSINVLAACNFDLEFIYVLSGWEGSAADSAIYHNALGTNLQIPQGRWLLGEAGFPRCQGLLVPYRKTRYHLKGWARGNRG